MSHKKTLKEFELGVDREKPINLLQLSDLHLSLASEIGLGTGKPEKGQIFSNLEARLRETYTADSPEMTDDLHRALLDRTVAYIEHLCRDILSIKDVSERLIIVPGNHDLRFKGLLRSWKRRLIKAEEEFYGRFADYCHHRLFVDVALLIACLDSNRGKDTLELASGYVDLRECNDTC
jgi:hypothetical protein